MSEAKPYVTIKFTGLPANGFMILKSALKIARDNATLIPAVRSDGDEVNMTIRSIYPGNSDICIGTIAGRPLKTDGLYESMALFVPPGTRKSQSTTYWMVTDYVNRLVGEMRVSTRIEYSVRYGGGN